jgi:TM2 domain-containing membrane protein YozV
VPHISYITPTTKVEDMFGNPFYRTSLEYWKSSTLNYTLYWILTVFLGFFGIDMLYLRSPLGMVAKFITNLFTFGYWWIYDAVEATFNKTQVQLVGPSAPFFGPLGIAGGQFMGAPATKTQLDKHYTFALYALAVCLGGIFGADSFLVGDKMSGWIRLGSLLTIIFMPVALLWWAYKIFMLFFQTGSVLDQEYVFFAAPRPANADDICPNVLQSFTLWILNTVNAFLGLEFISVLIRRLEVAYGVVKDTVKAAQDVSYGVKDAVLSSMVVQQDQAKEAFQKITTTPAGPASPIQKGGAVSYEDIELTGKSTLLVVAIGAILVASLSVSAWRIWKNGSSDKAEDGKRESERSDDPPDPTNAGADASE